MQLELNLIKEIAALGGLSRSELAARWEAIYRVPPPKGARRVLLERAIAWHLQAKAFGGLRKAALQTLLSTPPPRSPAATGNTPNRLNVPEGQSQQRTGRERRTHRSLPAPGARLIRDWHGKTHVVDVVRDGYVWQGQAYRSLSVIAREITGARWSGPRFFGL